MRLPFASTRHSKSRSACALIYKQKEKKKNKEKNWAELILEKNSGTITRECGRSG